MKAVGVKPSCGLTAHGKPGPDSDTRLCCACLRPVPQIPGSGWRHIGNGPFWSALGDWLHIAKDGWTHERDLVADPPQVGECVCSRRDCVWLMYKRFRMGRKFLETGRSAPLQIGQRSPLGRYPTLAGQVRSLLKHAPIEGTILDGCGSTTDAVCTILREQGRVVQTNDINHVLPADTHMDAKSVRFTEHFSEEIRRPDWIVSSPPYSDAFPFVRNACQIAKVGVAFKLRLSFLEPIPARAQWLLENPPYKVIVLRRATYRGRRSAAVEGWVIWKVEGQKNCGIIFAS